VTHLLRIGLPEQRRDTGQRSADDRKFVLAMGGVELGEGGGAGAQLGFTEAV
jgi:hypothetical protein